MTVADTNADTVAVGCESSKSKASIEVEATQFRFEGNLSYTQQLHGKRKAGQQHG